MSDLIEREDAIDAICDNCKLETDFDRYKACGNCKDVKMIMDIPSAERKGEWKDRTYGGRILHPWWKSCECSQCEEWGSGAWNFCPNCGAKMKGADDGSC